MADKKISELDQALSMGNDAVFPFSQEDGGDDVTFKAPITQLGTKIAEDLTMSNLTTTDKKLVGAINELKGVIGAIEELPTVKSSSGSIATFDTDLTENLVDCVVDNSATKLVNVSGNVTDLATYIRGIYQGIYGFVDLGSLTWNTTSIPGYFYASSPGDSFALKTPPFTENAKCDKYSFFGGAVGAGASNVPDKSFVMNNSSGASVKRIYIKDTTYSDAVTFTNSLQGVYLIYELDTVTTPTITQAQLTDICTSFGVSGVVTDLPTNVYPNTYNGYNNVFTDYNDITVKYLETIGKAISE